MSYAETTKTLSLGLDVTTGKYGGTTSTNITTIPVSGKVQFDKFFLRLTIPYIRVSSAGGVITRGIGPIKSTPKTNIVTQSGLGDITASAGYTFFEGDKLALDLVANVKFGTADPDRNLGTGMNDYSMQVDGYYGLDSTSIFATGGYKIVGAPEGASVRNIAFVTIGGSQKLNDKSTLGVAADAAQSSNEARPGSRELSVFFSRKITKSEKLTVYVMKGYTDSSPDSGFGVSAAGTF